MKENAIAWHFRWVARMGYVARGAVYLVIGGLAILAALGIGGSTTDSKGALMTIMSQPYGEVMLGVLIVGLFCYSAWRLIQAIRDTDDHGTSGKGLTVRSALFCSAVTHAVLAVWAIQVLLGSPSGTRGGEHKAFLATGPGQILLAAVGVAGIGAGLAHVFKGWTARFERYMEIPGDTSRWARPICRFGLIARGIVWCMVGWFLVQSSLLFNSGEIKSMADALASLQDNSYGSWLLGAVAVGLCAFGVYSVLESLYRRIDPAS